MRPAIAASQAPAIGRLRGGLVGGLVGTLAVAAHGAAGGGYPRSAELALMLLGATLIGWAANTVSTGRGPTTVLGLLAGGQVAGHLALSGLIGHHGGSGVELPSAGMTLAHVLATFGGAVLIVLAERLYLLASSALRGVLTAPRAARMAGPAQWLDPGSAPYRGAPNGAIGPRAPPLTV